MNQPQGPAPAPAPAPATDPAPELEADPNGGLRGVGRVLLINLGVLALYIIPALTIVGVTKGRGPLGEIAGFCAIVIPLGHGFVSMLVGLIGLLTSHRDFGAGMMISGPIILVIAFSACLGAVGLMVH